MPRIIVLLGMLSLLLLPACSPTVVTKFQYEPIDIPANYLVCERMTQFPDPDTLTDHQVNLLLAEYDLKLEQCVTNRDALVKYVEELNARIAQLNEDNGRN